MSVDSKPAVSVIITTYRRPVMLAAAIESVLAQSYEEYELIVAADGPEERTARVAAGYGPALQYLPLNHSAKVETVRNRAAAVARGRHLAFLDDDDRWLPEKLERQMAALNRDERAGYAFSDARFLGDDGRLSPTVLAPHQRDSENAFDNLLDGCFVHPSTVVIRRSLFERLGGFDERFFCQGDYDLWLRAAHAAPVVCVAEPLVYLGRNAGSSVERALRNVDCAIEVFERLRHDLPLSWRQHLRSRRTLARWHAHLGRHGEGRLARHHFRRSLQLFPWQRAAWRGLLRGGGQ